LLLRILQQNTSFGGSDPLAPTLIVRTAAVTAQSILFASLSITMLVAFIAVSGRQWIRRYIRGSTWGNIIDRGKERQVKLMGLHKWGLYLILESLPIMLQISLLLFGAALAIYFWDLEVTVAQVVLVVTSLGVVLYASAAVIAVISCGYPFQTPLSVLLSKIPSWAKKSMTLSRVWLGHWLRKRTTSPIPRTEFLTEHGRLATPLGRLLKISRGGINASTDNVARGAFRKRYPMTLSDPAFWRQEPLFDSSIPKDIAASAGFWLLENSINFSAATAVAAVFSEIQWSSHHCSTTALIRLRDTYVECFRAPELDKSARLKALQSAAAYYVLYHTRLIWSTSTTFEVGVEKLPSALPPDLFLCLHSDKWDGDDVFEYLLRIKDRSEPVTSARFLSHIAPYWFCGDSDSTIKFRPTRLPILNELIEVLEQSGELNTATITDCVLCAGAVMDFPLHPEDLIRVDKRCVLLLPCVRSGIDWDSGYFVSTFKAVVEHIHGIVLARGRRHRHAEKALEILVTLAEKTPLPLIDSAWITGLLRSAAGGDMDDNKFTLFMKLSARRKEEEAVTDAKTSSSQEHTHATGGTIGPVSHGGTAPSEALVTGDNIFCKIMHNVRACVKKEGGWRDEAVYGGLIAIRDIPGLGSCLPTAESLQTLSKAMEKGEGEDESESKPFRVRKAAHDVIAIARDGWLKSAELRPVLEDLDIPRKLHSVVIEAGRFDHQRSFLEMVEILSEDRYWHPYLRKSMDIWLLLEGQDRVLRILNTVGELSIPGSDGPRHPLDRPLEKLVEDEWARVPGRPLQDVTADRLKLLAEITEQFKELLLTESDLGLVINAVEKVVPHLENRRDDNYDGPGDDIRGIVNDLLGVLRSPMQSTKRRFTHW